MVAFPETGLGADTRDAVLTTAGAAALQVPTAAWLTHTWVCPTVFIAEPAAAEELGTVPSDCCPQGQRRGGEQENSVTYSEQCLPSSTVNANY